MTSTPSPRRRTTPARATRHAPAAPDPETRAAIAALVALAALDEDLLRRSEAERQPVGDATADRRHGLGSRMPLALREEYDRALRAGREPAVVPLLGSACSGCHVRLHAKLEHQIRARLGAASCPRCLRVVYDPTWLAP